MPCPGWKGWARRSPGLRVPRPGAFRIRPGWGLAILRGPPNGALLENLRRHARWRRSRGRGALGGRRRTGALRSETEPGGASRTRARSASAGAHCHQRNISRERSATEQRRARGGTRHPTRRHRRAARGASRRAARTLAESGGARALAAGAKLADGIHQEHRGARVTEPAAAATREASDR